MNDITEKYAELREELNNKDPLFRYAKLKEELDQKDPMFRYQSVKEEIEKIKAEKEEKTLESLENLFQALGGEEAVVRSESKITEDAEKRKEVVVEEPVRDANENDIQEEPIVEEEKLKEYTEIITKLEDVIKELPNDIRLNVEIKFSNPFDFSTVFILRNKIRENEIKQAIIGGRGGSVEKILPSNPALYLPPVDGLPKSDVLTETWIFWMGLR